MWTRASERLLVKMRKETKTKMDLVEGIEVERRVRPPPASWCQRKKKEKRKHISESTQLFTDRLTPFVIKNSAITEGMLEEGKAAYIKVVSTDEEGL